MKRTVNRASVLIFTAGFLALGAGCENLLSPRGLIDAGAAVAGGVIGNKLSKGDLTTTALAAGGAGVGADLLQGAYSTQTKKQVQAGYDQGRSDSTKQLYWASQRLQAPAARGEGVNYSEYEIPIPEQTIDGVIYKPTTKVLRIAE
jgi:hypothetical protein